MGLWIAMAVLTAAATVALLAPLYRSRAGVAQRAAEVAIYRDQLDEIARDLRAAGGAGDVARVGDRVGRARDVAVVRRQADVVREVVLRS